MSEQSQPSPELFFDTITAYQKTAALKAAVDLDLFTAIGRGAATATEVATRCQAAPRGVRILCDYLTVLGFLTKAEEKYSLTRDSAIFLDRNSPAYAGGAADFLLSEDMTETFRQLTASVRKGGTALPQQGSLTPEHPMWVTFANTMGGITFKAAEGVAALLALPADRPAKVLDIAAGHGAWGIAFGRSNPQTRVVALDWSPVLKVATANARKAGIADRYSTIAGSAFDVDLGTDYDVVLVPNFLHHFNTTECIWFLKRAHTALRPGGRVVVVEFVPNPDRVSPPQAAGFSLIMLATTPAGDAYTFAEHAGMLTQAGFQRPTAHQVPASLNQVILAVK